MPSDPAGQGLGSWACRARMCFNFILTNMRARRDQEGDFNALIGACQVGERALIAMLEKYGEETVDACIDTLLNMAETPDADA